MPGERGAAGAAGVKGEKVSSKIYNMQMQRDIYPSFLNESLFLLSHSLSLLLFSTSL